MGIYIVYIKMNIKKLKRFCYNMKTFKIIWKT